MFPFSPNWKLPVSEVKIFKSKQTGLELFFKVSTDLNCNGRVPKFTTSKVSPLVLSLGLKATSKP